MGNITEKCNGCDRIDSSENCKVYPDPTAQMRWVDGQANLGCAFNRSAHVKEEANTQKVRVGQQKQKKK